MLALAFMAVAYAINSIFKIQSKMKKPIPFLLFCALLFFTRCEKADIEGPGPVEVINCDENAETCQVAASNTDFGFNLFQELHKESPDKNIFISPMSVATALSMTVNGAKGQTREDMMATLEQNGLSLDQVNDGFKDLLRFLPLLDPEVEMKLANSIWYRQGFPAKEDFLATNRDHFGGKVEEVDFADPATRDAINGWVKENTNGLIQTILDQNIPPDVVMYLINTIYFKGAWTHPFDPELTTEEDFKLEDGTTVPVEMMKYLEPVFPYLEREQFQAADIPYGDSVFTMTVFLPKEGYTVDDVIRELNQENWRAWSAEFRDSEMLFNLPSFKMEYKQNLNKVLSALGMSIAFGGQADFTGIADASLYIDEVMHKAFIEVNEEGTEAGAATSVGIVETSMPLIPVMVMDRPFVFLIRDIQSNSVLFIGKMMNPNQS